MKPIEGKSIGVIIDLYLSLRAVKAYQEMSDLYDDLEKPVQGSRLLKEQYCFALNRLGKSAKAEKGLIEIINKYGSNPETNGILGRIYKDQYQKFLEDGNVTLSNSYLQKAISTYKDGFDSDWRDAYPGINLITLLRLAGQTELLKEYLPVVEFSAKQRIKKPDYWDLATLAEISIIKGDVVNAENHLSEAYTYIPDKELWMLETTLNNFEILKESFEDSQVKEDINKLVSKFKLMVT